MSKFSASGAPPSSAEGKVPAFADAVQRAKEVSPLFNEISLYFTGFSWIFEF